MKKEERNIIKKIWNINEEIAILKEKIRELEEARVFWERELYLTVVRMEEEDYD
ncbi:MAG: hypothetical protein N3A54_02570 [Patescibacteria group bacterium]|nr:hypothetical protein [Patescibacteria group bacterium]